MSSYIMPKLVSNFELSNKLIEEAKIKAKPESEKIKKSLKNEIIDTLVKNGISKKEAMKIASDRIEKNFLDPSFIIKFNDGKENHFKNSLEEVENLINN